MDSAQLSASYHTVILNSRLIQSIRTAYAESCKVEVVNTYASSQLSGGIGLNQPCKYFREAISFPDRSCDDASV